MLRAIIIIWALLLSCGIALADADIARHRPLVIWHGLFDSYISPYMFSLEQRMKKRYPGIFVYFVRVSEFPEEDRRMSYLDNLQRQMAVVATKLRAVPELQDGFDAIGISQGGQLLRAYVEQYNTPRVNNLITLGAQHMGVSEFPCSADNARCQVIKQQARTRLIYTKWSQEHLVQAQFYRNPAEMSLYLAHNRFLTDINGEIPSAVNRTYATNLASLNKLVLVLFSNETAVIPKESGWFGSYAPSVSHSNVKVILPMRQQPLYIHDTIGLRTLDERDDLVLQTCEGDHMQMSETCWEAVLGPYVGSYAGHDMIYSQNQEVL